MQQGLVSPSGKSNRGEDCLDYGPDNGGAGLETPGTAVPVLFRLYLGPPSGRHRRFDRRAYFGVLVQCFNHPAGNGERRFGGRPGPC